MDCTYLTYSIAFYSNNSHSVFLSPRIQLHFPCMWFECQNKYDGIAFLKVPSYCRQKILQFLQKDNYKYKIFVFDKKTESQIKVRSVNLI